MMSIKLKLLPELPTTYLTVQLSLAPGALLDVERFDA